MRDVQEQNQPKLEASIEPLLVRVEEAARILSLSRSTIYEMLDAGDCRRCGAAPRAVFPWRHCGNGLRAKA